MSKAQNSVMALSRGLYGKRITTKQFDDLLTMKSVGEIASYIIAYTPYSKVLENSSNGEWTAALLGEEINRYFFSCFSKICRFEIAVGQKFYRYFIIKTEVDQILECTRLILGNKKNEYLESFSSFLDKYLTVDLFALAKANSLEEISVALNKTPYRQAFDTVMKNPSSSYLDFEAALVSVQKKLQLKLINDCFSFKEKKAVFEALSREYDVKFICNLARIIKYYGASEAKIKAIADTSLTLFTESQLRKLVKSKSLAQVNEVLSKTAYRDMPALDDSVNITTCTGSYLCSYYKKQIRFSNSPSVIMLSFFYLCKTEKNNLIKIIQGNKYQISPEEIRKNLILS